MPAGVQIDTDDEYRSEIGFIAILVKPRTEKIEGRPVTARGSKNRSLKRQDLLEGCCADQIANKF
ncbi:hypothetical protein BSU04_40465 [Caballeronia sordidicola]|uniref:Uncharacterized protein n=1 Tax=Caballeronia sordidicola TaxID=196367 RepID=A0A226WNE3_CABSO|nr:hypothetical protein BSU04_40465 [Caballeronia sordidicola]